MRRTASPSRPSGRYAVGLRPSLDPDAYFGVPSQDKEARRTNQNTTEMGLDGPRSFRNDLQNGMSRDSLALRGFAPICAHFVPAAGWTYAAATVAELPN
jgi:hypothetical protein